MDRNPHVWLELKSQVLTFNNVRYKDHSCRE